MFRVDMTTASTIQIKNQSKHLIETYEKTKTKEGKKAIHYLFYKINISAILIKVKE